MSMQDPIADLFSRINNAQARGKSSVLVPSSNKKINLVSLLTSIKLHLVKYLNQILYLKVF